MQKAFALYYLISVLHCPVLHGYVCLGNLQIRLILESPLKQEPKNQQNITKYKTFKNKLVVSALREEQ